LDPTKKCHALQDAIQSTHCIFCLRGRNEDPKRKKRPHRKAHGVIDFLEYVVTTTRQFQNGPTFSLITCQNPFFSLSKEISERWRRLPAECRQFYHNVAKADRERYNALEVTAQED
jgi:HMG-box domain